MWLLSPVADTIQLGNRAVQAVLYSLKEANTNRYGIASELANTLDCCITLFTRLSDLRDRVHSLYFINLRELLRAFSSSWPLYVYYLFEPRRIDIS